MCATINDFSVSLSLREEGRDANVAVCFRLRPASPVPQAQIGKSQLGLFETLRQKAGAAPATGQVPALISRLGRFHLWQKRTAFPALSPGFREGGSGETPEGKKKDLRSTCAIGSHYLSVFRVPASLRAGPRAILQVSHQLLDAELQRLLSSL